MNADMSELNTAIALEAAYEWDSLDEYGLHDVPKSYWLSCLLLQTRDYLSDNGFQATHIDRNPLTLKQVIKSAYDQLEVA